MPRPSNRRATVPHWRSGSESKVAALLDAKGVPYEYEKLVLEYITPATKHRYTPDFRLLNSGVVIEVKGLWTAEDRQKINLVRKQNPDLDLRMLFDRPQAPINKGSKTTYGSWCAKHGIPYAKGPEVPPEWLSQEPPTP